MNYLLSALVAVIVTLGVSTFVMQSDSPTAPAVGGVVSPDVYSYFNVHGPFSQGGGTVTVTPSSASLTLTGANMRDANVITFTASTTQPALTVTLPATSSFPLPPEAGAYRDWIIINPFTGTGTTTTIAAGTGIDLQEPDGQNVVIGKDNFAWLTCFRKVNTDIVCNVDETIPAD